MGAEFWQARTPWEGDLSRALEAARAAAWASVAEEERARELPLDVLLRGLDVEAAERRRWRRWLKEAPASSRYVLSHGPDGTGTVLDVDHVSQAPPARGATSGGQQRLVLPAPGLAAVRLLTEDERRDAFGTTDPTMLDEDHLDWPAGHLNRGEAVAIVLASEPPEVVFVGVTGD